MARAGAGWTTILAANRALEWHETISFVSACRLKVKHPQSRRPWGWRVLLRQLGPVAVVLSNPFTAWIVVGLAGGTEEWGMIEYLDLQGNCNVADFPHLQRWLDPGPGRQVQLWHA